MLPNEGDNKKEKEKTTKKKEDNSEKEDTYKRRNSLTDNSSLSATSSNNSSADSDEASSSSIPDTKGTMTSHIDLKNVEFDDHVGSEFNAFHRTIRTDTPVDDLTKGIGFRSLSRDYPLDNTQPNALRNLPSAGFTVKPKPQKSSHKKKRDKKEKKERVEKEPTNTYEKILEMKTRHETAEMRKEIVDLYQLNNRPFEPMDDISYPLRANSGYGTDAMNLKKKLMATVGCGVASTGLYEMKFVDSRNPREVHSNVLKSASMGYHEIVGNDRVNWRSDFDNHHKAESLNSQRTVYVHLDSIDQYRYNLREMVQNMVANEWIKHLLNLILDGKIKKVWKRIRVIQKVLRERIPKANDYQSFNCMDDVEILELIMQVLSKMLTNSQDGFNVIMYLLSHPAPQSPWSSEPCFHRNHGDCMMAELILHALPASAARYMLSSSTFSDKRRAVHFTTIAGFPCQLNVALQFGVDTNFLDIHGQSPMHCALARNNTLMVKQLLWHGSDLSFFDLSRRYTSVMSSNHALASDFLRERVINLERCMSSWLKALFAGKWKLLGSVTSLHCARLPNTFDNCHVNSQGINEQVREVSLKLTNGFLDPVLKYDDKTSLMMFALPVMFTEFDAMMPDKYPHIVRTKLAVSSANIRDDAQIMTQEPTLRFTLAGKSYSWKLPSAIKERNNGYVYAWEFPKKIDFHDRPDVSFHMNTAACFPQTSQNALLFIQVFRVQRNDSKPICRKQKKD